MLMNYKFLIYYIIIFILLGINHTVIAAQEEPSNISFSIGIEDKRMPYSYLDENKKPAGILIDKTQSLCHSLKIKCDFILGEINDLLFQLRALKIQAVLIQDAFVIPSIDKIVLSPPLCKLNPIFIQKKTASPKNIPEDFTGSIIGVQKASSLHIYLLDNYNSLAHLKPYIQLESGVFDLVSGRIDVLFSDEAFFKQRILSTSLGNKNNPEQLILLDMDAIKIPEPTMTLAFRENDKKYIKLLKDKLSQSKIKYCSQLVKNIPYISTEN